MPLHTAHIDSSNIRKEVVPEPPQRQHKCPPKRRSPGRSLISPGDGDALVIVVAEDGDGP